MKTYLSKLILLIIIFSCSLLTSGYKYKSNKGTFISLAPSITEIIYAIEADNNLLAVTSWCDHPKEASKKPKVGDAYAISQEAIIKLKPESILALESQKPIVDDLKLLGIKVHYFSSSNLKEIYQNIEKIGQVTGYSKEANKLADKLRKELIYMPKAEHKKTILYVAHPEPLISIGKQSFITDIINQSGHTSITNYLENGYLGGYPRIGLEFILLKKPDVVVVADKNFADYLSKFLKNTKFVILTYDQLNMINRPGPRINEAVKLFSTF